MVIIMELIEWLGVQVLEKLMETGKFNRLQALDISYTQALSENAIYQFLQLHGFNLKGLMLVGKSKLTENFWLNVIPFLKNIRSVDCLVVSPPHTHTTTTTTTSSPRSAPCILWLQFIESPRTSCSVSPPSSRTSSRWAVWLCPPVLLPPHHTLLLVYFGYNSS